jgi:DNA-binding transcriptional LysR family regulator
MTLQQLTYFLAAADHRSFSAAAESLHMAQPSLSDQIRRLEAELGVALFARGGRRLELTEAGRLLLPEAERTLEAAQRAADSVREVRTLTAGTATFGTFGNAPYYLLSDLVQDFKTRHPGVHVRLTGLNSSTVADAVRDGHLEAGLIVLPIDDRGLEVRPVARDEIVFMSRDPKRLAEPMTIQRIVEAPLILYDARYGWDDPTRRQLLERAQEAGVTLEPDIEVEYVEAALELCARGLGDTIAARAIGLGRGFARRLGTTSFDPPLFDTFAFIHRRNAHLSPATRAFMTLAEKRITGLVQRLQEPRAA